MLLIEPPNSEFERERKPKGKGNLMIATHISTTDRITMTKLVIVQQVKKERLAHASS